MNRLAIFDIDGTLTDTNGVDDECYREAVAQALGVNPEDIDWSGAAHVTDSEIFQWLCTVHGIRGPAADALTRARSRFVDQLTVTLEHAPTRFSSIGGAAVMLRSLAQRGWDVAVATGGWRPSARLKLRVAELAIDDAVFACADDALSRENIVQLALHRAETFYRKRFDRVVSVGDGVWDVKTARILGLPFVGIGTGERATRLRGAGARTVLNDYSDLDAVWAALDLATIPGRDGQTDDE